MKQTFLQTMWEQLNCPWSPSPREQGHLKIGVKSRKQPYKNSSQYLPGLRDHEESLLAGLRSSQALSATSNCRGGMSCHHGSPCRAMAFIRPGRFPSHPALTGCLSSDTQPTPSLLHHYQRKYLLVFSPRADV